ncbi:hypothetical protein [Nocardia yamanashiensis]|uniref:hypothetical protein n=1 Tax=Nocardia yamanashiensis TaxID=209247 RepID=UPI00082F92F8|nr:hypothetical protein [Nocardia yamanashiensis]
MQLTVSEQDAAQRVPLFGPIGYAAAVAIAFGAELIAYFDGPMLLYLSLALPLFAAAFAGRPRQLSIGALSGLAAFPFGCLWSVPSLAWLVLVPAIAVVRPDLGRRRGLSPPRPDSDRPAGFISWEAATVGIPGGWLLSTMALATPESYLPGTGVTVCVAAVLLIVPALFAVPARFVRRPLPAALLGWARGTAAAVLAGIALTPLAWQIFDGFAPPAPS